MSLIGGHHHFLSLEYHSPTDAMANLLLFLTKCLSFTPIGQGKTPGGVTSNFLTNTALFTGWTAGSANGHLREVMADYFGMDISTGRPKTNGTEADKDAVVALHGPMECWAFLGVTSFNGIFAFINIFDLGLHQYPSGWDKDLSRWDTGEITDMSYMFQTASGVQNIGAPSWNTSSVTNMEGMFSSAYSWNEDISGWDVANVENMRRMFMSAVIFNQGKF